MNVVRRGDLVIATKKDQTITPLIQEEYMIVAVVKNTKDNRQAFIINVHLKPEDKKEQLKMLNNAIEHLLTFKPEHDNNFIVTGDFNMSREEIKKLSNGREMMKNLKFQGEETLTWRKNQESPYTSAIDHLMTSDFIKANISYQQTPSDHLMMKIFLYELRVGKHLSVPYANSKISTKKTTEAIEQMKDKQDKGHDIGKLNINIYQRLQGNRIENHGEEEEDIIAAARNRKKITDWQ